MTLTCSELASKSQREDLPQYSSEERMRGVLISPAMFIKFVQLLSRFYESDNLEIEEQKSFHEKLLAKLEAIWNQVRLG